MDDDNDQIFCLIKNVIRQDSEICNFSRYIDYGKILKKQDGHYKWTSIPNNEVNDNNGLIVSSVIRFVNKIDTKFLFLLTTANYDTNEDTGRTTLNILYDVYTKNKLSEYSGDFNTMCKNISKLMINIDCEFPVKGVALTPFDFIGKQKNSNRDSESSMYWRTIYNNIKKMIFVGDKCFLIAVIDRYQNVYVSLSLLKKLQDLDTTENKDNFKLLVRKLIHVISKCCVYFVNKNISHYLSDMITTPLINDIYKNVNFDCNTKIMLQSLDTFSFQTQNNIDSDSYIKENICGIIRNYVENYINNTYYWDAININGLMKSIRQKYMDVNQISVTKAYMNGVRINSIFLPMGWNYLDPYNDSCKSLRDEITDYLGAINDRILMYKEVKIIPKIAYVRDSDIRNSSCRNKINPYRILNSDGIESVKSRIHVDMLIMDVTKGTMYCLGKHPNVNGVNVCMGDLKGKVTFTNNSMEECRKLITSCENLLNMCNYTSSYNTSCIDYFLNDNFSSPYNGMEVDENSKNQMDENSDNIMDVSMVSADDLYDDDETTSGTISEVLSDNVREEIDSQIRSSLNVEDFSEEE